MEPVRAGRPHPQPDLYGLEHVDVPAMPLHEALGYRAAAEHARRVYPGPLGELVHREITAFVDFGHRLRSDALIPRLAATVLAQRAASTVEPGRGAPSAMNLQCGRARSTSTTARPASEE